MLYIAVSLLFVHWDKEWNSFLFHNGDVKIMAYFEAVIHII